MKIFEKKYIKELFYLALPIIMGNLGHILLGAGDCFVAGRYSTSAVAAISIATSINATIMMFGTGLVFSISPILSNKRGAKEGAKKYFYPSLRFAIVSGLILMLVTFAYIPLLGYLGFEKTLLKNIQLYTWIVALSTIPAQINITIKEYLQSFEIIFFPNLLLILSVVVNIFFNYIFVYGKFGLPEMGVGGIALATTLVRTMLMVILFMFCIDHFKFHNFVDRNYYKQIIKIGFPLSVAIIIEFIAFNYIAVILGRINGIYAAAHSIIMILSSSSFMIPTSIANALAVKVGYANGSRNYKEIVNYIKNGMGVSISFMLVMALVFFMFPHQLAGIFTRDKALINIIVPVMSLVAFFQVSDGIQSTLSGVFKGLKRTKFVMISNTIAYLFLSISLGFYLGVIKKMYLYGCWLAIAISSVVLATILICFLLNILRNLKKEYAQS